MIKLLFLALILYVGYRMYKFSWRFHQAINNMRSGMGGAPRSKGGYANRTGRSKVYTKDVGEYVDFEEIDSVEDSGRGDATEEIRDMGGSRVSDAEYEDIR